MGRHRRLRRLDPEPQVDHPRLSSTGALSRSACGPFSGLGRRSGRIPVVIKLAQPVLKLMKAVPECGDLLLAREHGLSRIARRPDDKASAREPVALRSHQRDAFGKPGSQSQPLRKALHAVDVRRNVRESRRRVGRTTPDVRGDGFQPDAVELECRAALLRLTSFNERDGGGRPAALVALSHAEPAQEACSQPRSDNGLDGRHPFGVGRKRLGQARKTVKPFGSLEFGKPPLCLSPRLDGLKGVELRGRFLFLSKSRKISLVGGVSSASRLCCRLSRLLFKCARLLCGGLSLLEVELHRLEPLLVRRFERSLGSYKPQKTLSEILGTALGRLKPRMCNTCLSLRVGLGSSSFGRAGIDVVQSVLGGENLLLCRSLLFARERNRLLKLVSLGCLGLSGGNSLGKAPFLGRLCLSGFGCGSFRSGPAFALPSFLGFGFGERTFGLPQSCSGLKLLRLSLACRGLERGKRRRFTGGVGLSSLDLGLAARNVGGNPVERSFHVLILDPVPEGFGGVALVRERTPLPCELRLALKPCGLLFLDGLHVAHALEVAPRLTEKRLRLPASLAVERDARGLL